MLRCASNRHFNNLIDWFCYLIHSRFEARTRYNSNMFVCLFSSLLYERTRDLNVATNNISKYTWLKTPYMWSVRQFHFSSLDYNKKALVKSINMSFRLFKLKAVLVLRSTSRVRFFFSIQNVRNSVSACVKSDRRSLDCQTKRKASSNPFNLNTANSPSSRPALRVPLHKNGVVRFHVVFFSRWFGRSLWYGLFQIFVDLRLRTMTEPQQILSTQSFHTDLWAWTGLAVGRGAVFWCQRRCFHWIRWTICIPYVQIVQTLLPLIRIFHIFLRYRWSTTHRLMVPMDIVIEYWRIFGSQFGVQFMTDNCGGSVLLANGRF